MQATDFVKQLNDISSISPKDSIKWLTFERVENSLSLLYLYSNLTVKPEGASTFRSLEKLWVG